MSFAYCDFHNQGAAQMLLARAVAHPHSLRAPEQTGSAEMAARVETPRVEAAGIAPVKSEPKPAPAAPEMALELRRSTQ
jgi:hypothetical protein